VANICATIVVVVALNKSQAKSTQEWSMRTWYWHGQQLKYQLELGRKGINHSFAVDFAMNFSPLQHFGTPILKLL
jgi:hypothetical protein